MVEFETSYRVPDNYLLVSGITTVSRAFVTAVAPDTFVLSSPTFVPKTGSETRTAKTQTPMTDTDNIFAIAKLFLFVTILFPTTNELAIHQELKHCTT